MDQRLADLLALLELEALEVNLFRGASRDIDARPTGEMHSSEHV